MSFLKGDLLTRTRKLVKGLAKSEPIWLKAMEHAPPATFPRADGKVKKISLPEDVYIKKFFQKHPDSKHEDAIKICGFDPPPARIFGLRVLDLKEQGVSEEEAMAVADMEYRAEKKAKKKAYSRLKQIARLQGKKPPPNPYPSAIKEIQAEERKYVRDRFFNPKILEIVQKLKEEKAAEAQDRFRGGGWFLTFSWQLFAMSMASLSTLFYFILQLLHILLSFGSQSWICIKSAKIFRSTWISIRICCYQILYWPIFLQDNGLSGRKWNPLHQRLDSYDYTVKQHVGSLLFTPFLLVLPTSIFYSFFSIVNLICILIEVTISGIHATPYIKIFLWLAMRTGFPSGIWFEIVSCCSNLIDDPVICSPDKFDSPSENLHCNQNGEN